MVSVCISPGPGKTLITFFFEDDMQLQIEVATPGNTHILKSWRFINTHEPYQMKKFPDINQGGHMHAEETTTIMRSTDVPFNLKLHTLCGSMEAPFFSLPLSTIAFKSLQSIWLLVDAPVVYQGTTAALMYMKQEFCNVGEV